MIIRYTDIHVFVIILSIQWFISYSAEETYLVFFFCKQKTAYEMRISDWSSDVCSSDLAMPWLTTTPTKRRRALENLVTEQDLDTSYTALAEAIARVGQERAPLFMAMLALSLIARQLDTEQTLNLITQAEQN